MSEGFAVLNWQGAAWCASARAQVAVVQAPLAVWPWVLWLPAENGPCWVPEVAVAQSDLGQAFSCANKWWSTPLSQCLELLAADQCVLTWAFGTLEVLQLTLMEQQMLAQRLVRALAGLR